MLLRFRALFLSTTLLLISFSAVQAAAQPAPEEGESVSYTALRPGLWEIRTATRMQGMPYELPPVPYRTTQCLTQEQLDNQQNLSAVAGSQGNCDIHDTDVTEERTNWTMSCIKNGMEVDAEGTITPISKEAYTGNVTFTMQGGGIPMAMNGAVNVQGLWQGECNGNQSEQQMTPSYRRPPSYAGE